MMDSKHRFWRRLPYVGTAPLLLVLAACGAAKATSIPTLSVEEIFTSAAQTFEAQQATELALNPPTETPAPTVFPTLPPASTIAAPITTLAPIGTISFDSPTASGASAPGCDNAAWVADVSIPDGTKMDPDQNFKKTWTLNNTGTCAWDTSYQLAYVSGDKMNGGNVRITVPVPPGQQINLTIDMQAPGSYGDYKGTWQMQNGQGQNFGSMIWVSIKVRLGNVTDTPAPTP